MNKTALVMFVSAVWVAGADARADKRLDDAVAKAQSQLEKGRSDEALKTLQRVVSQDPNNLQAQVALANMQERTGATDEAVATLTKALALPTAAADPYRAETLAAVAQIELARGSSREAKTHAEEAVRLHATGATLASLAFVQARMQDAKAALQNADRAVESAPNGADAHEARGRALLALTRADEAGTEFQKSLELDPKRTSARIGLASTLMAQGKAADAGAAARQATEADPHSSEAFAVLGLAVLAENPKNWNDAIAHAQQSVFLNARDPFAQTAVGYIFEAAGNLDQAASAYRRGAEADPSYTPARAALIQIQFRRGEIDAALVESQKLVQEQPQSGEAQLQLGRLFVRKGDYAAATKALDAAAALLPNSTEAYALRGTAYHYTGKTTEALAAYKRAVELAPTNVDYRTTYALLLGMAGQAEAGAAELQKIVASPNYKSPDAYINLGWLYRNLKKTDESIAAYKKALELDPQNEQAALGLGRTYFNATRLDDAIAMYRKALELEPKLAGEANDGIAWAYVFKKDVTQARDYMGKAQAAGLKDARLKGAIDNLEKGLASNETPADVAPTTVTPRERPDVGTLSDTLLHSPDAGTRRRAARDLGSMGSTAVPALIRAVLNDRDRGVQEAAVIALGNIGPAAKDAVPHLKVVLQRNSADKSFMTPEEMKEMMREEDFRRLIRDALQKIQR